MSPPGCVLHIGMGKTGTTSIQVSLRGFSDAHHHCVDLGTPNASIPIATAFSGEPWLLAVNQRLGLGEPEVREQRAEIRLRLQRELIAAGDRISVISGEGISELARHEISDLIRALDPAGAVQAVAYVRPPKALLSSNVQQQLKAGADHLDPAAAPPNYRRFENFDRVLGRESVSLWKFDPARFPDGDVVRDFCARLGLDLPEEKIIRRNDALSLPAAAILFAYRRFGRGYGTGPTVVRENNALVAALREVPGPPLRLADEILAPALADIADDVRWMEERLGEELSEGPTQGGIASEEELLEIDVAAVETFVDAFQRRHALRLPRAVATRDDSDPQAVARTLHACRRALREKLRERARRMQQPGAPRRHT